MTNEQQSTEEASDQAAGPSAPAEFAGHGVPDPAAGGAFQEFVDTIAALRAPDGCPWDKVQTHNSIATNMIEEACEAVDAMQARDMTHLREELGDVLLEVVLQTQIAADEGHFTISDVCRDVNQKMIRRHPHIFGDASAADSDDVLDLWEAVKAQERAAAGTKEGLLDSVPLGFPALLQAQKVSKKAAKAGFEWDTLDDVWNKVAEETSELKDAYAAAPKNAKGKIKFESAGECGMTDAEAHAAIEAAELEFGDMLFALVNVGRRMGIDAETALLASTGKFRRRWAFIEQAAAGAGRTVDSLTTDDLNELWDAAKQREAAGRANRE